MVQMMKIERNGHSRKSHGLISVVEPPIQEKANVIVVGIGSLVAMAHLVQDREDSSRWYVNTRIDLWMFDKFCSGD